MLRNVFLITILLIMISGCAQTSAPSVQQQQMVQMIQSQIMTRYQTLNQQPQQQIIQQKEYITEEELIAKVDAMPALTTPVEVEYKKAGVAINGVLYLDPEGKTEFMQVDPISGDATYVVYDGQVFTLKFTRVGVSVSPIVIAEGAKQLNGTITMTTVTGKKLTGETMITHPRGLIASRGQNGFIYEIGKPIISMSVPDDFIIYGRQRGEVIQTGLVIAYKPDTTGANSAGGLFNAVKSLGSQLGVSKKEDFILCNFNTGKIYPLNIGHEVLNAPMFDEYDMPEGNNLFWRLNWYQTELGPMVIVREDGLHKVQAYLPEQDMRVSLFERALGINWFYTRRGAGGKIEAVAQLGLSKESIDDVVQFVKDKGFN